VNPRIPAAYANTPDAWAKQSKYLTRTRAYRAEWYRLREYECQVLGIAYHGPTNQNPEAEEIEPAPVVAAESV
jgi:hypothetical protein